MSAAPGRTDRAYEYSNQAKPRQVSRSLGLLGEGNPDDEQRRREIARKADSAH
jgi:hypothetical protein